VSRAGLGMVLSTGLLIDAVSGVLIFALGIFVVTRRPLRATNVAFTGFALSWGGAFVLFNVFPDPGAGATVVGSWLTLGAAGALVYLLARFPRRLEDARLGAVALVVGVTVFAAGFISRESGYGLGRPGAGLPFSFWVFSSPIFAASLAGVALFALRFARARGPEAPRERSQYALTAAALLMDIGVRTGLALAGGDPGGVILAVLLVAVWAAWLRNAALVTGAERRAARNLALLALVLPLAGLALTRPLGGYPDSFDSGILGVARTLAVAIFAYAILKHQLLDIDVKVRWGISKTTVAAVFVAVFFIVSEGAQEFFGERADSQYLGIVAAGMLVFAIAPLIRVADRLAHRAVPIGEPPRSASRKEETYRDALRVALRDRVLSSSEELAIARLAEELGIGAGRAMEIRQEVEAERGVR